MGFEKSAECMIVNKLINLVFSYNIYILIKLNVLFNTINEFVNKFIRSMNNLNQVIFTIYIIIVSLNLIFRDSYSNNLFTFN
jgi:hypothetical protein